MAFDYHEIRILFYTREFLRIYNKTTMLHYVLIETYSQTINMVSKND